MEKFSERLKELRIELKLTVRELADKIDVDFSTISKWEKCKIEPTLSNIAKMAKFFNVSSDYLIGLTDWES